jgi:hypothetical protein
MSSIASSPQSDALEQRLLAQLQLPEPTLLALQRVRELEREFMKLRRTLADPSNQTQSETDKQDQVANLLSRVVLLRLALPEEPGFGATVPSLGQDDATAIAYRALRS